ncbi:MAG: ethanolamine utilization protein EutQ (cupin superfamily) [Yoonia sp.]|jgi:ethanolamine utilization protein EutQ (cupin superfamily)
MYGVVGDICEEAMKPTAPRVMEWSKTTFNPRFEYGDQAAAAPLCGTDDGSKLGAGFGRMTNASFPWTVQYHLGARGTSYRKN